MEDTPLKLLGAPGSPYTRKMLALLRYRRIPHAILWGGHQNPPADYPSPKVKLLPTFYFPDGAGGLAPTVDSTPIIRKLETLHANRCVVPDDPALGFLNYLIEDYADEWLTKAMFHYRWHFEADRENAGPLLVHWSAPLIDAEQAKSSTAMITKRQFDRLYVVGSNDITAETIERSYERFLAIIDTLIQKRGYLLGARPASADFAVYGQMTQLAIVEPTSAAVARRFPRVRAWIDRMEDLSGLEPAASDWIFLADGGQALRPLLSEIGRVYAPFLLANSEAVAQGRENFETEIDGRPWKQPAFPYQAKCLGWIREAYHALDGEMRAIVDASLSATGCEAMLRSSR
jgi:glutathione S-transferase